jgi:hypothetical protein
MEAVTNKATLRELGGAAHYTVTLKSLTDGKLEEFPLAAPQATDSLETKDFMVKDRTQKAIADTEGMLDPDTRAKLIAEVRIRTQSHTSVLLDQDGITYIHFLMAKRAGFTGNWKGFSLSLQDDIRTLQNNLFALFGIVVSDKPENPSSPFESGTIAP